MYLFSCSYMHFRYLHLHSVWQGEHIIRTEDIVANIMEEGDSIALVLFGGKHYKA